MSHAHVGGHDDHGGGGGHGGGHDRFGLYVGLTMAVLGVLLAICSAKVGGERTELVKTLVAQEHAHAKYQAQDIKHRVSFNNLLQVHSAIPDAADGAKASAPKKADVAMLAATVDRYLGESKVAQVWVESFNPAIDAHVDGQEQYELGQLLAEVGIVVASIALMVKSRAAWFISIVLGLAAAGHAGRTYANLTHRIHVADEKIEETGKAYRDLRGAGKTTAAEEKLVAEVRAWTTTGPGAVDPAVFEQKEFAKNEGHEGQAGHAGEGEKKAESKEPEKKE